MTNATYLTLVVIVGVLALLFLVMKLKVQAFVTLLIVSMGVALAAGMPLDKIMGSIQNGMGGTLGFIAVVVGLGAMFGQMLEVSGGAERLARTLIKWFGKERASWALMIAGFIISIPVFFDVGFIILVPIVYSLAKETKKSLLFYGIPLLAGLAVTHTFVPPTPGPVAVAQLLNADIGKVIFYGLIAGIPTAIIAGPVFGKYISDKIYVKVPEYILKETENEIREDKDLPSFGFILFTILLPIVLILLNTWSSAFLPKESSTRILFGFIGHPFAALLLATLVAFIGLGTYRGMSKEKINEIATSALAPAGLIILVTGAGGVFKQVLIDSGVGKLLAESVAQSNVSPIFLAFLIAAVVRVAQGSATVAMMTAGGIMAPMMTSFNIDPAWIVISIAAGATILSHVNDSGFWLVNRYFGISEKDTLKSWTMMETIIAVVGVLCVFIFSLFI
ncbi:High-affinity gluconate transporter [Caloramator mitchellensis]|uniref:High-affinity gluconate transporter n=1 Tax=Caloramator mitchellensis TaxID=908809 RepID=A0A0R3JSB1_CALMK|nr:GntP family permease [Caloramator mitchellensis]KRQ86379.1 High-affinity gluconate transporter [Caloramator mitchellensis]